MLRILSDCSASVRKSLQGLDYFVAEGAQAFDNLVRMVHQMSENVAGGKEWEKRMTEHLKASKLYLKGDFKVMILPLPPPPPSPGVLDISLGEEVCPGPSNPHHTKDKKRPTFDTLFNKFNPKPYPV